VTIASPRHDQNVKTTDAPELLIKEARRKARLRRLRWGGALGVVLILALELIAVNGGFSSPPPRSSGTPSGKLVATAHKSPQALAAAMLPSSFYPQRTLDFVTSDEGWLIDPNASRILVTHNGGSTWSTSYEESSSLQSKNGFLRSVDFVNADDGWALINFKGLIATTDAGRTWSLPLDPTEGPLMTFSFSSPEDGWALTDKGALMRTTNGARTWRLVSTPAPGASICATPSGTLWLGDNDNGNVYVSHFGAVWHLTLLGRSVPANSNSFGPPAVRPAPWISCTGITVWLLYNYGESAGSMPYVVERTLNAGASWKIVLSSEVPRSSPRSTPGISATVVDFGTTSPSAAWIVGYCGPCTTGQASLSTTSNASTFSNHPFVKSQRLYVLPIAVSFLSSRDAWALVRVTQLRGLNAVYSTTRYVVERTTDGGRSWAVSNPGLK